MDDENNNETQNAITLFPVICIALLLIALFALPHGYYTFLRIVICLWGVLYGAAKYNSSKGNIVSLLCFGIAILYNPFIPIQLKKHIWDGINGCTAGAIAICSVNMTVLQKLIRERFKIPPGCGMFEYLLALILVFLKKHKTQIIIIVIILCCILVVIYEALKPVKRKDTTPSTPSNYLKLNPPQSETGSRYRRGY